jgi:hypothetical protein
MEDTEDIKDIKDTEERVGYRIGLYFYVDVAIPSYVVR